MTFVCQAVNRDSLNASVSGRAFRVVSLLWTLLGLSYISMVITSIRTYYVRSTGTVHRKVQLRMKVSVVCICL